MKEEKKKKKVEYIFPSRERKRKEFNHQVLNNKFNVIKEI